MPSVAAPLAGAARSALRLDRGKISVGVGLRVAVGVGACLVAGRASGHTVAGVTAAIGALTAGLASHQGAYRSRVGVVLGAAAATGACAAIGSLVGHVVWLYGLVAAAVGLAGGMLVSLGPGGTVIGVQALVGLVVFSQFRFPLAVAARDGGLVLLGGAVPAVLVMAGWPLRRFEVERRALADAFAALGSYCRDGVGATEGETAIMDQQSFTGLDVLWRDAQPLGGEEASAYRALGAQADRLRLELTALVRARARRPVGSDPEAAVTARLDEVLETAGAVLLDSAEALRRGRPRAEADQHQAGFEAARRRLAEATEGADGSRTGAGAGDVAVEVGSRVEALAGQLRAVVRTVAVATGAPGPPTVHSRLSLPGGSGTDAQPWGRSGWGREVGATLRSNLHFASQSLRHAVRMAVTLAVAVLISEVLPYGHRYWLPMTALLVLRPDFTSTVARGVARVVGTLFGAGVVTVALAELRPGADGLIVIVVGLTLPAATFLLANYAVYSACIASLVVALLAFIGEPGLDTAFDRSIYTLAGAAVALAAYLAWPTWEATTLADTLAGLAATEGRYARLVLDAWSDPAAADGDALQRARLDARLARSNAAAATSRWLAEPETKIGLADREAVIGFMASVRICVSALLSLHAELPAAGPGWPEAAALGADVAVAMDVIAAKLKGSPTGGSWPAPRKAQLALAASRPVGVAAAHPAPAVLAGETDRLVDALDGIGHLLGLAPGG